LYVVAAGTLESLRLMLVSNDVMRDGIGNHSGWLGRSYLAHLEATIGELRLKPSNRGVIWGYERSNEGIYVRRRFAVTEDAQEKHQIGNAIARLSHPSVVDPVHRSGILSAAYLTKFLLVPEYSRRISWVDKRTAQRLAETGQLAHLASHFLNVLKDLPRVAAFGPWWLWVRNVRRRKMPSLVLQSKTGTYLLDVNVEQSPNLSSRVHLIDKRDKFDVPQIGVDWRISSEDVRTIRGTLTLIREAVLQSGCGEFEVDLDEAVEHFNPVGGHQMGGSRMSADPQQGVVDAQCRVHGIGNLYLAGCQVFPTVSYANPTLTAVALALRLSAHLRERLKSSMRTGSPVDSPDRL
jgi:choline dehydrogenase-like flavoprotein